MANTGWTITWIDAKDGIEWSETFRTKKLATSFLRLLRNRADVTNLVLHRTGTAAY